MSEPTSLVWFKRDLRLRDHQPLVLAARRGRCVCLYIYEPELLNAADYDPSHLAFVNRCLDELREGLRKLGGELITRVGEATLVFSELHRHHRFDAMYSHQETGNDISYKRDMRVKAWARDRGIVWREVAQHGVVRVLKNRDGWAKRWNSMMRTPVVRVPKELVAVEGLRSAGIVAAQDLGLSPSTKTDVQAAGESQAWVDIRSFLKERGERYQKEMSSPLTAERSCSRLSTHLAYGTISMRSVWQTLQQRRESLKERKRLKKDVGADWLRSLASFDKRLHWHCHFIQKLESQPELEFKNMASVYDGLREPEFDSARFDAWREGRTGYPMVDACMRYLSTTGWLNFRMRAMVVSFASYHLWLHWRQTGLYLAKQFVDYEPGIHYSQMQMQSGTTGINAVRIYSPTKQLLDQDPEGVFVRRWVPELTGVPTKHLGEPGKMSVDEQRRAGCLVGKDYPEPLVEHRSAVKQAKERIYALRRQEGARAEAQAVFRRHGSRRSPADRARQRSRG